MEQNYIYLTFFLFSFFFNVETRWDQNGPLTTWGRRTGTNPIHIYPIKYPIGPYNTH